MRLVLYDDATGQPIGPGYTVRGNPTIGTGINVSRITQAEADWLLTTRINAAAADLTRAVPWWIDLPEPQRSVLADLCFNMGWPALAGFTHFLAAMQARDWSEAAAKLRDSRWWSEVGTRGPAIEGRLVGS